METKIDHRQLDILNLEELEELSREYRLGQEAQVLMENEAMKAIEDEKRMGVVEAARNLLPECLGELIAFDSYEESHGWKPRLMINGGEWRLRVWMVEQRKGSSNWSLTNYPYEVELPRIEGRENGGFVRWFDTGEHYENLVEAIGRAMEHAPLADLYAEVDRRNAEIPQLAAREPVYVSDDLPQGVGLTAELIELIRDVAAGVFAEKTL